MKFNKIKRYIISILFKIILLIAATTILSICFTSGIISNDIAMTQFDNSDTSYMLLETYNKTAEIVNIINIGLGIYICAAIAYDVYKIVKTINNDNDLI